MCGKNESNNIFPARKCVNKETVKAYARGWKRHKKAAGDSETRKKKKTQIYAAMQRLNDVATIAIIIVVGILISIWLCRGCCHTNKQIYTFCTLEYLSCSFSSSCSPILFAKYMHCISSPSSLRCEGKER